MRSFPAILGLALIGAVVSTSSGFAQNAPAAPAAAPIAAGPVLTAPTVALVDIQRVVADSAAGKNMLSQLDTERKKIREQLARMDEDFKNQENELRRQRSILSQDALNEQAQGLQRKQADYQRIAQERQEAFSKAANDAQSVIFDNMRDVVQQISAERRIGLVVRKDVVMAMTDKNMDITDDVIQRLNSKLPTVTVTVPAAGATPPAAPAAAPATAAAPAKAPVKK
jgi:outer membrane protein